jgi:hypothetical protein
MCWTHFLNSTVASLPSPVEVDINSIPAHAWELAMAELILSDQCWIGGVHPGTTDRHDVFKVVAWYSCPSRIPLELDLEIVEPPMEDEDPHPAKHTLVYPVTLSVTPVGLLLRPADPPSPPSVNEE